jgi:chromosome segregation ATPase
VSQFSVDLSILLSMNAVTFNDFVDRNGSQEIFQRASQVLKAFEEANRRNQQFTALADHIAELFGESPDLFARVSALRNAIDEQTSLFRSRGKKCRELRNRLRDLKMSTDSELRELTAENGSLKETLEELHGDLAQANGLIKKLKKELSLARQELKDLEISSADAGLALKSDHERLVDNLQSEHSAVQQQLRQNIEELNQQLEMASETIAANEAAISKFQTLVHSNQQIVSEKSEEIAELERQRTAEVSRLTAQNKAEKANLVQSYESALAELKNQCDAHRSDLERVSRDLSQAESRIRKQQAVLIGLKKEKMKLQNEMQELTDKTERDTQVNQAMLKSATLTAESNAAQRLQEAKSKFEGEKRRIFSVAAEEFRTYFNAADCIDERSYRTLLAKVRNDLKRLSEADAVVRRLVGAAPRQTTDEAVAQHFA